MPLTDGTRIGPYEILNAIGAGGMSACGHAQPKTGNLRRGIGVGSRRGWGPAASDETMTPSPCRS
jgi:hypothetical protein